MSEPKLISPMLDNFSMGDPISDRNGVRCCPAMENETDNKYIVKIISTPASQTQLDALLLTGVYETKEAADAYFKSLAEDIIEETLTLERLSRLEGFLPYASTQLVPMEDATGYDVYLLSPYRNTLAQLLRRSAMTQLSALNLALDLCAALTISRRAGHLYVNLKPENIYFTSEKSCKIGDIGFLPLNALRYASLPDRYRSAYTAPEINDALANINTTVDVYALGLILYQIYNDGILPVIPQSADEAFTPPAYADYEMAEIILKACDPNPANRWADPVEMGQAIVGYMQRNGVHDTPIVPVVAETSEVEVETNDESSEESAPVDETPASEINVEELVTEEDSESAEPSAEAEEDEFTNLSFLSEEYDEMTLEEVEEEIADVEVSEEVTDMLDQADDLIAHPTPDPVVQPEAIDVQIPEPVPVETEEKEPEITNESAENVDTIEENEIETQNTAETVEENTEEETEAIDEEELDEEPPKKRHILRNIFIVLLILALGAAAYLFYTGYYLQPVDSFELIEQENGDLTVLVSTPVDESKLTVVCSDTYGNQSYQPVENGKAVFTDLAPDSAYTVKIVVDGFHKLTGDTSGAFTTPVQTNIVQFIAVTGAENGSAILSFTVDGPDSDEWTIQYLSDDGQEQTITFAGHMYTVTDLTPGNEYKFTLSPASNLNYDGETELVHTASNIIKAKNLQITGLVNNVLTAAWTVDAGIEVESWTVRCYNDNGYDKTVVVNEMSASFEDVSVESSYIVEVTAANMSVNERAFATANSVTVNDFKATLDDNKISLSWNSGSFVPEKGWLLTYSVDGSPAQEITDISNNAADLTNILPSSNYIFTLQTKDGPSILGGQATVETAQGSDFSNYGVSASNMTFSMCKTPNRKYWDKDYLSDSDYKSSFTAGENASFLVKLSKNPKSSNNKVVITFVIRDKNNTVLNLSSTTTKWNDMWTNRYCSLNLPAIPSAADEYTVSVYFNGELAHTQNFTVS